MKESLLIADSGGSGTDWGFINTQGEVSYFSTESYHPSVWNDEFFERQKSFWQNYPEIKNATLHFYGAGCLNDKIADQLEQYFIDWGFHHIIVKSDIHAAALATLGLNSGFVAILGTGSVMAEMENGNIKQVFGGLGYLLGDEGSGYYFGKLLLKNYLENQFSHDFNGIIERLLGSKEVLMKNVYGESGKSYIASLAYLFSNINGVELKELHIKNIDAFIPTLLNSKRIRTDGISLCGSYANAQKEILLNKMMENSIPVNSIIAKPIQNLTEYFLKETF